MKKLVLIFLFLGLAFAQAANTDIQKQFEASKYMYSTFAKLEKQILSLPMIQLWSANQLGPTSRRTFDTWRRRGYSYALGVRTRVNTNLGGKGQVGEFGWDGAAGAWVMIDPVNHLSAFYAQHVRSCGFAYDTIHPTIRSLIYEELGF